MKLTATQLKKIIAEEIQKSINEAPASPEAFYAKKSDMLRGVLATVDSAIASLQKLQDMEESQGMEEDTDLRSAMMDLMAARDFIEGIHSAVDAMV